MSGWETYNARLSAKGGTRRDNAHHRLQSEIQRKAPGMLSYVDLTIDGVSRNATVLNTTDFHEKKICSVPGEELSCGSLVVWEDYKWLITDLDPRNEVYYSATMKQCNYILKWVNPSGDIIEKDCIVEDGTKYLIGEKEEDTMTIGAARIAVTLARDSDTAILKRGRRFLIDDPLADEPLAYEITKPNKLYSVYDGAGVFRFILTEVNSTGDDSYSLMIADYFKLVPSEKQTVAAPTTSDISVTSKETWI